LRVLIDGFGVTDRMRSSLASVVAAALDARPDHENLSVVLTRLLNGEWMVFITDGTSLELVDGGLAARIAAAAKEGERSMDHPLAAEDRRVLEAIARAHGHGPPRPIALLDIAWTEVGSEEAARAALQRLLLLGLVDLEPGRPAPALLGRLTSRGAEVVGYS
jgi:hypothetical protein